MSFDCLRINRIANKQRKLTKQIYKFEDPGKIWKLAKRAVEENIHPESSNSWETIDSNPELSDNEQ